MRRRWPDLLAALAVVAGCHGSGVGADPVRADGTPGHGAGAVALGPPASPPPAGAEEALQVLRAGNARFVSGHTTHPHTAASFRARLAQGQHPFVTVVGCSDSRVPPEMVFDEGFGDLFVVRVAGNVVDADVTASVEYGVDHLHTPLVLVMGHEGCGAVTAAAQHLRGELPEESEPPEILGLLRHIEPGLLPPEAAQPLDEAVAVAVEDNVRHSIRELSAVPDVQAALQAGEVHIVGAIYDLDSGRVRFLDESP